MLPLSIECLDGKDRIHSARKWIIANDNEVKNKDRANAQYEGARDGVGFWQMNKQRAERARAEEGWDLIWTS